VTNNKFVVFSLSSPSCCQEGCGWRLRTNTAVCDALLFLHPIDNAFSSLRGSTNLYTPSFPPPLPFPFPFLFCRLPRRGKIFRGFEILPFSPTPCTRRLVFYIATNVVFSFWFSFFSFRGKVKVRKGLLRHPLPPPFFFFPLAIFGQIMGDCHDIRKENNRTTQRRRLSPSFFRSLVFRRRTPSRCL